MAVAGVLSVLVIIESTTGSVDDWLGGLLPEGARVSAGDPMELRRSKISSIVSVKYFNNAATPVEITVDASNYFLRKGQWWGEVLLKDSGTWPSDLDTDETEQRIVQLRMQGHSGDEIAQKLGLTPVNVRVRLTRLRQRLRLSGLE